MSPDEILTRPDEITILPFSEQELQKSDIFRHKIVHVDALSALDARESICLILNLNINLT